MVRTTMDAAVRGWGSELVDAAGARLTGPGGYYNAGNAIGLAVGIGLQVSAAGGAEAGTAVWQYLAGNAGAVALTAATVVFFWSGEAYHRAWAHGFPPNRALNRRGDLTSGIGALMLGIALLSLGQLWLAATAGLLHALGKFGSAYGWRPLPGWQEGWPDVYRCAVLASRVPALLAALIELARVLPLAGAGAPLAMVATPPTLVVCYLLWCRADLMLFAPAK